MTAQETATTADFLKEQIAQRDRRITAWEDDVDRTQHWIEELKAEKSELAKALDGVLGQRTLRLFLEGILNTLPPAPGTLSADAVEFRVHGSTPPPKEK